MNFNLSALLLIIAAIQQVGEAVQTQDPQQRENAIVEAAAKVLSTSESISRKDLLDDAKFTTAVREVYQAGFAVAALVEAKKQAVPPSA